MTQKKKASDLQVRILGPPEDLTWDPRPGRRAGLLMVSKSHLVFSSGTNGPWTGSLWRSDGYWNGGTVSRDG